VAHGQNKGQPGYCLAGPSFWRCARALNGMSASSSPDRVPAAQYRACYARMLKARSQRDTLDGALQQIKAQLADSERRARKSADKLAQLTGRINPWLAGAAGAAGAALASGGLYALTRRLPGLAYAGAAAAGAAAGAGILVWSFRW